MVTAMNIGYAMCGSYCTFERSLAQMKLLAGKYELYPIMSENAYSTDTRFGRAVEIQEWVRAICGREIIHSIVGSEPLGPKNILDALVIAPCTGNTAAKLANAITDTSVTMAAKSLLRVGKPIVLCVATNDALAAGGQNLTRLLNTKNIYLVPFTQDDHTKKPSSLVADFTLIEETLEAALEGRQLQPVISSAL